MGQTSAMLDFFVLEASDYLERLDRIAQAPAGTGPSGDDFVRLARAFRGSALMATQRVMARAGQGLEAAARAVRDGRLVWDERVRGEVIRAVDDCKILLRRVKAPEAGDAQRAEGIGLGLERLAGRPPETAARAPQTGGLDAGSRAFVGREAAAIASTLDRAARALDLHPASRDVLGSIAPAMSQLRGVAILNDLPPLADLLASVDGAVKLVLSTPGSVPGEAAAVFDAAAKAVARAAREVVDAGRPTAESGEAQAFASALLRTFVRVGEPVPIGLLCATEPGPHVLAAGQPPDVGGSAPPRLELVSLGEFLSAVAGELGRAGGAVLRDLRLFVIGASLKPLIETDGSVLGRSLAGFAEAGWWAIGSGSAAAEPERFAAVVSDAAEALRSADDSEEMRIAQQLDAHANRLLVHLRYPLPEAVARPAAAVSPAAAAMDEGGLAASWSTYETLIAERGLAAGSLDEFLGAARAPELPIVPIESLAPSEPEVVPIETLLYDREGALRRLREIRAALGAEPGMRDLLGEVFDLVDIGFGAGA